MLEDPVSLSRIGDAESLSKGCRNDNSIEACNAKGCRRLLEDTRWSCYCDYV